MIGTRASSIRAFVAGALIISALAFLQSLSAEKDLFSAACAYSLIAFAALLASGTEHTPTRSDLVCLAASGIFFCYVILRAVTSPVGYVSRADLCCVLGCLTLYGVAVTSFSDSKRRIALIVALLAFAVVHVLVSVVQFGLGRNYDLLFSSLADVEPSSRGTGLYVDPDHLAGLLEVLGILGLSITAWSRWPNWSRVCVGYLTAVCYLGLLLSGSRGGYLSTVASLIAFCLLSFLTLRKAGAPRLLKFGGAGGAIIALLVAAAWFFVHENAFLQQKLHTITDVDRGRIQLWQSALEQWHLRPIVGTGSGTYLYYGRQFRSPEMQMDPVDVHNDYLHLLCEYGILGAAGFLFFFFAHLRQGWRAFADLGPRRIAGGSSLRSDRLALNIGALSAVAAYVVHSAVDFNLHIPANALPLAFVFGLIANPGLHAEAVAYTKWINRSVIALAAIVLLQCLRLIPGEYFAEKSRVALRDEDPATAIAFAEKALTYERRNPTIYFYLGRALVALGSRTDKASDRASFYELALNAVDRGCLLAPLDEIYPLELARVYDRTHRFEEAEAMFAIAWRLDPRSDAVAGLYAAHLEAWKNSPNQ